jgi:hypothetical protein
MTLPSSPILTRDLVGMRILLAELLSQESSSLEEIDCPPQISAAQFKIPRQFQRPQLLEAGTMF